MYGTLMSARDLKTILREHIRDFGSERAKELIEKLLAELNEADCVMISKAIKRSPD
jgi:plasmid stabilization system protein ParE